ncbi:hypothetical protein CHUAL_003782 [Chamberlinius hualienensis]
MVWSDLISWLRKKRNNWNNERMESNGSEEKTQGAMWCCSRDQMSVEKIKEAFTVSQWQKIPHWLFVSFRCLAAVYFTSWLVTCWISFKDSHKGGFSKWFIYLTNWSFGILVLQTYLLIWPVVRRKPSQTLQYDVSVEVMLNATGTVNEIKSFENEETNNKKLGFLHKLMWICDNIASTMAIGVTVVFWACLFDRQQPPSLVTIHTHGINAVYVLLDQLFCRRPRHLSHFYQPIIFGVVYVIFSAIYWGSGGTDPHGRHYVYPFLDWEKPLKSSMFAIIFSVIVAAVIYLLLYGLYILRTFVHSKLSKSIISRRNSSMVTIVT